MYEQEMYNYDEAHLARWENDATFSDYDFIHAVTAYRNLSIADALVHKDFIIQVLAILDRRVADARSKDWCRQMTGTALPRGCAGSTCCGSMQRGLPMRMLRVPIPIRRRRWSASASSPEARFRRMRPNK